jgi:homoserine dehydrogenase
VYDPVGLDPKEIESMLGSGAVSSPGGAPSSGDTPGADTGYSSALDLAEKSGYDILLELTPLDIFTGQPATDHIRAALSRGKHAVSANKGPVAWAYRELASLARANGALFFFETAVMDGAPLFNLVNDTLKLCRVTELSGILNSTTNFILDRMKEWMPMEEIMAEGKRIGFVEADPGMDVLGWDAAAKTAALMNVLMDADIRPSDIRREGIENVTYEMIEDAASRGRVIKLVCRGYYKEGRPVGEVKPEELGADDIYAAISGTTSIVQVTTDLMGKLSIVEHDPLIGQTAYGILSDVLRVVTNTTHKA